MGLYLLAPPLAIFLEAAGRRGIVYLLVLWFLFGSLLPTVGSYLGGPVLFMASTASSVFSYSGFFVLGHVLRSSRCPPRFRLLLGILFVVGLAATLTGTYMVTVVENGGEFRGVFYEYYSPNVSLMAVTLFMLVKSVRTVSGRATRILSYMGACVPGIYLVHALVIVVLKRGVTGVVIDQYLIHPAAGVPLFAGVVFIISFAGVGLIRLIPLVRRILP
jgi:surface polysaccharide O-acyltransferase-like enzyme